MKSEHRHELKTNELAEWLSNFPTWAKDNATILIPMFVVLGGVAIYLSVSQSSASVDEENRAEFTQSLARLLGVKGQVAAGTSEGGEMPLTLAAQNLAEVATSSTDGMAAFALIKRAEALRSAILFQSDQSAEAVAETIREAQASYQDAQAKAEAINHKTLLASATYGLGLCEEELKHYDEAAKIYRELIASDTLKGTAAQASAGYRLKTLDAYRTDIVFTEAPEAVEAVNLPPVTIPWDPLAPLGNTPVADVNQAVDSNAAPSPVLETPPAAPLALPDPPAIVPLPVVEANTTE